MKRDCLHCTVRLIEDGTFYAWSLIGLCFIDNDLLFLRSKIEGNSTKRAEARVYLNSSV